MLAILIAVRSRVLPALVTALGVVLVTAGLLTYVDPTTAGTVPDESPVTVTLAPTLPPPPTTEPTAPPSDAPSPSLEPTPAPTPGVRAVATRVLVPALKIDLPVIDPPGGRDTYPLCDVAMYIKELAQPGEGRATYLYAHARTGMFLPILDASKVDNGRRMLGMTVQVFTTDDKRYLYEVVEVRRHQTTLDDALSATEEEVWLQTSEGPRGTPGKTQLVARFLSVGPADPAQAHPAPKPVVCG